MDSGWSQHEIAAELEQRLALLRASAEAGIAGEEDRQQHLAAIAHLADYAALLRTTAAADHAATDADRYLLKLELADGRWDLIERPLPARPHPGLVLDLAACGAWQVKGAQFVRALPMTKPAYEFFVCAPAA
jgi:hypothetical protein